jgi:hypothetical protein
MRGRKFSRAGDRFHPTRGRVGKADPVTVAVVRDPVQALPLHATFIEDPRWIQHGKRQLHPFVGGGKNGKVTVGFLVRSCREARLPRMDEPQIAP